MLAFLGDFIALTVADCTKRSRYSNRAVSNSNLTVTEEL